MAIETYGLRVPDQPDLAAVEDQIQANFQTLQGAAQAMVNAVTSQLNANATRLASVEKRVYNSINGHLRRNNQLLQTVPDALMNAVTNGISDIQSSVNMIASRPEVQQWLTDNPPPANWSRLVPPAPAPGDLTPSDSPAVPPIPLTGQGPGTGPQQRPKAPPGCHWRTAPPGSFGGDQLVCPPRETLPGLPPAAPPPAPAPSGSPPPVGGPPAAPPAPPPLPVQTEYAVLYNCALQECAAVPNFTAELYWSLHAEGWETYVPAPYIFARNETDCQLQLERLAPFMQQICAIQPGA